MTTSDQGPSYRPISQLAPKIKILERLIIPDLVSSLSPNASQHGFRPRHSTITALLPLATTIARGFNNAKPASCTGLLSIDLSKAFDVVDRDKLLDKIESTNLNPNLKRWLLCYLRDRRMRVRYQGRLSKWRKTKLGMPQGAVSSPPLWNFFGKDLSISHGVINESFADDFHNAAVSPEIDAIVTNLCNAAEELDTWAKENGMVISAQKSTVTLFMPWTKQVNVQLNVSIGGVGVPTEKNPGCWGLFLTRPSPFRLMSQVLLVRLRLDLTSSGPCRTRPLGRTRNVS